MRICEKCGKELKEKDQCYEVKFGIIRQSEMEELGLIFSGSPYKELHCTDCLKTKLN